MTAALWAAAVSNAEYIICLDRFVLIRFRRRETRQYHLALRYFCIAGILMIDTPDKTQIYGTVSGF